MAVTYMVRLKVGEGFDAVDLAGLDHRNNAASSDATSVVLQSRRDNNLL